MGVEEYLLNEITYCPLTGLFTKKKSGRLVGSRCKKCGYVILGTGPNRKTIRAHRAAWFLSYGYWPNVIDHINRVRHDNRLINLRDTDAKGNAQNTPQVDRAELGIRCVWFDKSSQRWTSVANDRSIKKGAKVKKSFSVRKYGYEGAKLLAEQYGNLDKLALPVGG